MAFLYYREKKKNLAKTGMFWTFELLKHLTGQSGHTKLTAKMHKGLWGKKNGGIGKQETDKFKSHNICLV